MHRIIPLLACLVLCGSADADGLETEVMLHPMDGFTADTLPAGQVIYNQSVATIPLPSWMWIGVTDWLSAEIDLLPLIGGLFIEPHYPVPSFNLRARLLPVEGRRPGFAIEVAGQHMWAPNHQETGAYRVTREGTNVWAHLNMTVPIVERLRMHVSVGASWTESIEYGRDQMSIAYASLVSPDASVSIDWRAHRRLSFHATGSYGTTFVYSDNQPRKWELAYGFRVAPFLDHGWSALRTMRFEFPAILTQYRDLGTGFRAYFPIVPYVYWQFSP